MENTQSRQTTLAAWRTVVWDDPINLMDYVTEVFARHFGYPPDKCEALMLCVHICGKAIVSTGLRERMEADVMALHGYGLRATLERDE
ncbi:ATP-dependent Clp protease adapter ClpS [Schaalia suimastitidis]|uniref:ATP-dependent Clp protease adapter ClpS n=1 Tax=Schaalia suimastitidis TaxID=121163 RepID=UPI00047E8526|nr:ATP-dependent Clp protease adapter ClpS [Schaalia suimastitidis]